MTPTARQNYAQNDENSVQEATALAPKPIYEVIRREGKEEMARRKRSLICSGVATGAMINLPVLGARTWPVFGAMLRLWAIVLSAFGVAALCVFPRRCHPRSWRRLLSYRIMRRAWGPVFLSGAPFRHA